MTPCIIDFKVEIEMQKYPQVWIGNTPGDKKM